MLTELEIAILQAIDRLTPDGYGETDGETIEGELLRAGHGVPPGLLFARMFTKLEQEGFLTAHITASSGPVHVELTGAGRQIAREAGGFERSYSAARQMVASDRFAAAYPGAFGPWADAERLLWADDAEAQLTTIGHKVREATQAFATALVNEHRPPGVDNNPANIEKRLGAVIAMHRERMPESHRRTLEALGDLWEADNKLIQRQEHGAQKEGEPVSRDDARRIVFLTMFLMIEFVSILEAVPVPPPATLER